jgi:hypothetical protein
MTRPRTQASRWPRRLRRHAMERIATLLVASGVVMMLQPFAMALYHRSFLVTLSGTLMFVIVSKVPE